MNKTQPLNIRFAEKLGMTRTPSEPLTPDARFDEFGRTPDEAKVDEKTRAPLATRKRRRLFEAAQRRAQRKGQRAYVRQELARESAATDLANLFNIIDRHTPASPRAMGRAHAAITARVVYLSAEDRKRYDAEFAAWKDAGKEGDAPRRPLRGDEIRENLRGIAKTAKTYAPR